MRRSRSTERAAGGQGRAILGVQRVRRVEGNDRFQGRRDRQDLVTPAQDLAVAARYSDFPPVPTGRQKRKARKNDLRALRSVIGRPYRSAAARLSAPPGHRSLDSAPTGGVKYLAQVLAVTVMRSCPEFFGRWGWRPIWSDDFPAFWQVRIAVVAPCPSGLHDPSSRAGAGGRRGRHVYL